MRPGPRTGWLRCALALGAAAALIAGLAATGATVERFLKWFDWLSPMPGLSGLALLVATPVALVVFLVVAQWVVAGFDGPPDEPEDAQSRNPP